MKEIITCYFATIGAMLGVTVSLMNTWIPLLVLFVIVFALCVVRFAKIMQKYEEEKWDKSREISRTLDGIERNYKAVRDELARKMDKPEDPEPRHESNVRPGSRPSITYQNMIVERTEKG